MSAARSTVKPLFILHPFLPCLNAYPLNFQMSSKVNPFGEMSAEELSRLRLKIVQQGEFDPQVTNYIFRRTNTTIIPPDEMITIIYEKY